jgi:hypothetical protein
MRRGAEPFALAQTIAASTASSTNAIRRSHSTSSTLSRNNMVVRMA